MTPEEKAAAKAAAKAAKQPLNYEQYQEKMVTLYLESARESEDIAHTKGILEALRKSNPSSTKIRPLEDRIQHSEEIKQTKDAEIAAMKEKYADFNAQFESSKVEVAAKSEEASNAANATQSTQQSTARKVQAAPQVGLNKGKLKDALAKTIEELTYGLGFEKQYAAAGRDLSKYDVIITHFNEMMSAQFNAERLLDNSNVNEMNAAIQTPLNELKAAIRADKEAGINTSGLELLSNKFDQVLAQDYQYEVRPVSKNVKLKDGMNEVIADFERAMGSEQNDAFVAGNQLILDKLKKAAEADLSEKLILAPLDDLELAITAGKNAGRDTSGLLIIAKKMKNLLKNEFGLWEMMPMGQALNSDLHEAVGMRNNDQPEGNVIEVVKTGYLKNGKLFRPSQVIVSQGN